RPITPVDTQCSNARGVSSAQRRASWPIQVQASVPSGACRRDRYESRSPEIVERQNPRGIFKRPAARVVADHAPGPQPEARLGTGGRHRHPAGPVHFLKILVAGEFAEQLEKARCPVALLVAAAVEHDIDGSELDLLRLVPIVALGTTDAPETDMRMMCPPVLPAAVSPVPVPDRSPCRVEEHQKGLIPAAGALPDPVHA